MGWNKPPDSGIRDQSYSEIKAAYPPSPFVLSVGSEGAEVEGLRKKGIDMSFWVYILHCCDDSYYTGHTDNLEKRVAEHQSALLEGYTACRRPIKLVFSQEFGTRAEALRAEFQIKGWTRRKKEALIKQDWQALKYFAKGKHKQNEP